jgi:hypothetical protein
VVIVGERKCGKTVLLRKIVEELERMDYLKFSVALNSGLESSCSPNGVKNPV